MKLPQRIILTALMWAIVSLPAQADETTPSFGLGVTGAYSRVTFFRGSGVEGVAKLRSRNSFAFGINSHYRLYATDRIQFGVQPELLYARRGVRVEYAGSNSGYQLDYLELPLLGRILLLTSGAVQPYVAVGPRFGLLLSAERTDANGSVRDESDDTNTFDLGFSAGAGALIHVGSRVMISIEGRYDQSLMNRIDDNVDTTADQRHRAFFLMLGVSMGIGGPAPASADASPVL
jgi:opacity protein-like surface antigen